MTRSKELHMRIDPDSLEQIDGRARVAGLSRSDYMIRAALGEITDPGDADARFADLSRRLERLERLVEIGGMQ